MKTRQCKKVKISLAWIGGVAFFQGFILMQIEKDQTQIIKF